MKILGFLLLGLFVGLYYACEIGPEPDFKNKFTLEVYLADSGYQTKNFTLRCLSPKDTILHDVVLLDAYVNECQYELKMGNHYDTFSILYNCQITNQTPNQVKFYNFDLKSNRIKDFQFYDVNRTWDSKLLKINYR
jgi:hypothetical protein